MMLSFFSKFIRRKDNILIVIILAIIILLAIFVINSKFTIFPFGPDEHAYQGAALRMVDFNNKDLTIFYPNAALIFPYFMGVISVFTNLDIMIVFRMIHIIVIITSIITFYYLGNYISKKNGILLAILVALFHTTTFWLGLGYLVPSTLIFIILPLFILSLLRSNLKLFILTIVISGFLYWWSLFPLIIMAFTYFLLLKKRYFLLLAIFISSYVLFKYIFYSHIISLLGGSSLPDWYFSKLFKILGYYAPFVILAFIFVNKMIKDEKIRKYFMTSLALITTNLFILLVVSEHSQMRTIIFLFSGSFMLFSLLFESFRFKEMAGKLLPLIFILFLIPLMSGVALNYENDVFSNTPLLEEETDFFDYHSEKNNLDNSAVLSDYSTMLVSTFHLNDNTYLLYKQIKNKEENGLEWLASFLAQEKFEEGNFKYLEEIMAKCDTDTIYLTISPRTRYWVNIWEYYNEISKNRVVDYNIEQTAQSLKGEVKFETNYLFEEYYENQSMKVYKYTISD